MGRKTRLLILAIACFVLAFAAARTAWEARRAARRVQSIRSMVDDILLQEEKTVWQQEGWVPEDFFFDPQMQQVCHAVSGKDSEVLRQQLAALDDPNRVGASGATLLHWAFFDDNLPAFELLLEEGVDPDATLTDFIWRENKMPFTIGDSILFTSLREKKFNYFFACLPYTKDVNQLSASGESFLNVATGSNVVFSIDRSFVKRLADNGIDLDHKDRYGGTAAYSALVWNRPGICLEILKAGADPDIGTDDGDDVASRLALTIEREGNRKYSGLREEHQELLAWLQSR